MYAPASLLSAGIAAVTSALPFLHLGAINVGIPVQWFGMIVAAGVLIGATPLRRYAEWHGVSDEHIRGLLTWVMVAGFLGAHEFDVLAYQWNEIGGGEIHAPASWWFLGEALWPSNWPLALRIWDGISSFGGFIGGSIGFALFVWWKRLPARLFADITIVGLLPAFSIGRIACTVVSDHIGAAVDPERWYSFLAMDYPRKLNLAHLNDNYPGASELIRAWNLGLLEFLYLVPVNLVVLSLAFRPSKPSGKSFIGAVPAGFLAVLVGVCYAPVRFLLDFLRPEESDPRYFGLTFAQWSAMLAFGVAIYAANRIFRHGAPAETITRTSRETQDQLKLVLREDAAKKPGEKSTGPVPRTTETKPEVPKAEVLKGGAAKDDAAQDAASAGELAGDKAKARKR